MDFYPLIAAFGFIFLSELGDKTQITTMILASKAPAKSVFMGAILAFLAVDGMSALVGGEVLRLLPYRLVSLVSGGIFIGLGLYTLIRREEEVKVKDSRNDYLASFSIIFLMELGDKTQIASLVLSAQLNSTPLVLAGIMLAFTILTLIAVLLGAKFMKRLPEKLLKIVSSLLFIIFGILFISGSI
ncbi:TMEM165/GDT1 family protein [Candidatus Bathyarchaeota archaeon]|nr:TMEM165/GDT1 family protein [Candidatus Bathyarchaeota archaeon]